MRRLRGLIRGSMSPERHLRLLSITAALLSTLATVGPLYGQTPTPQPQTPPPGSQPPAASPSAAERILELSLADAVRLALQNNLDIERERYGPLIQQTEIGKARATFDPSVGAEASVGQDQFFPTNVGGQLFPGRKELVGRLTPFFRQQIITGGDYELRFINFVQDLNRRSMSTTDPTDPSTASINPRYENHLEITFTQPLLRDFGIAVNKAAIYQAELATDIARQQLVQTILDTVFLVQQSYWDLVFRIQNLEAQQESLKLAQDFLEENRARVELGTLAPIELVQAETQVKLREGDVIVAEAAVQDGQDRLKEVLNIPETLGTWDLRIRPTDSPNFEPAITFTVEPYQELALQHRPDFRQSQLAIASREIARDVARNQKLPRLDIFGAGRISGLGGNYGESLSNLPEGEGYGWLIGLRFEYPLGNRFARNEFQRRELELKQARVDQRQLIRLITRQLRAAIREIETAIKRVEVARSATMLARTQLEAEQEKFRLGLSTSFVVLDFQADLTLARTNETRALSDYNIALGRLDQLTGTLQYGDLVNGVLKSR